MHNADNEVTVTEEDRAAALTYWNHSADRRIVPITAIEDDHALAQAFARHRLASIEAACRVSGVLRCAKCDFRLVKTTLNVADGNTYANNEPDRCPNCDVPMWRVSWKEEAGEAYKTAESQMNRALAAEAACREKDAEIERLSQELAEETALRVGALSRMKHAEIERDQLRAKLDGVKTDLGAIRVALEDAAYGDYIGAINDAHGLCIDAERAFLASAPQPEQKAQGNEPVAWMYRGQHEGECAVYTCRAHDLIRAGWTETPLYAHPPAPASVEADNDRFRIMLLDLLAVIHGDGGYKTQEIGVDMAHAQALQLSAERKAVPVEAEAMRAAADDDLARLIETRLLGIPADEQDLILEDHDWRRIIEALSQPVRGKGDRWLPIESAPRDGVYFLAFWPVKSASEQVCATTYDDGRFMDAADHIDWVQPTHWMPLPTPPASEEG